MHRLILVVFVISILGFIGCKKDVGGVSSAAAVKAQAVKDDQVIQAFIKANNLTGFKSAFTNKDSVALGGLYYQIVKDTADATIYSSSTLVTVGYTGRVLPADTVFTQTNSFHPSFTLGEVIRGWSLCIPYCNKGGAIRILMASRFAYGPYEQPTYGLKPNSVLDFTINIYDVTN